MPNATHKAERFFAKALAFLRRDFFLQFSYRLALVLNLFGILLGVSAYYFLSRLFSQAPLTEFSAYGSGYFSFILIGVACYNYMNVAIGTFSNSIREAQAYGTLEAMILTRTSFTALVFFSNLWAFLYTLFQFVLYLLIAWAFFGLDLSKINFLATALLLLLIAVSFSPFGLLSAAFTLAFKKGDPVFYGISMLSALLGGVYYPLSVLPEFLQKLAPFLPLTLGLSGLRKTLALGANLKEVTPEIFRLLLLTGFLVPLALLAFKKSVRFAKVQGTLAHF